MFVLDKDLGLTFSTMSKKDKIPESFFQPIEMNLAKKDIKRRPFIRERRVDFFLPILAL
jgi:hypothetical protein